MFNPFKKKIKAEVKQGLTEIEEIRQRAETYEKNLFPDVWNAYENTDKYPLAEVSFHDMPTKEFVDVDVPDNDTEEHRRMQDVSHYMLNLIPYVKTYRANVDEMSAPYANKQNEGWIGRKSYGYVFDGEKWVKRNNYVYTKDNNSRYRWLQQE